MNLQHLQNEMIIAMKTNNVAKRDVLRSVIAAIKKAAIDERCEATEELVDKVLLKEAKTIQEQINTCPDERADLKIKYGSKAVILSEYVPQLETDEAKIRSMIEELIAAAGIEMTKANRSAIMKAVMPALKGKVDMKVANKVIGDILV